MIGAMDFPVYPLVFKPAYKDYVWGGSRIGSAFGRQGVPPICAESWELSAHPDGLSRVATGALAGLSLADLTLCHGAALVGARAPDPTRFPLLFKLIDARDRLSVQVHPNAATAAQHGGEPKTEMWVVLDSEPGAFIHVGLKPGVGPDDLRRALETKQAGDCLNTLAVQAGDAILIPGGLVHAIGAGCLIYEVQQNSNTTYRLYDWDRLGSDGRPRPLHVAEALAVIDWTLPAPKLLREDPAGTAVNVWHDVLSSPFFRMRRIRLEHSETVIRDSGSFQALFVHSGTASATINGVTVPLPCGTSCLIPAAASRCTIRADEPANLLLTTLPV
ncbi:MAG: class I mannose-6-phosphate isomerase [Lentisphaerae bacterium]|nr:class I mannose-6-phosphate isomerase [Lentisphaerota bacterium]